ncbi:hypothetical protein AB0M05_37120 [Streptomyces violaceusniger]
MAAGKRAAAACDGWIIFEDEGDRGICWWAPGRNMRRHDNIG